MTSADILIVLIIGGGLLVGFFWGVLRVLLLLAAWFVVFIAAAYLAEPLGRYLAGQWVGLGSSYTHMAAFGIIYAIGFILAVIVVVMVTRGTQDLTRFPLLDDIVGSMIGGAVAVLVLAGLIVILRTFYGESAPAGSSAGPAWTLSLYRGLVQSMLGGDIAQSLVPLLGTVIGPILPATVRNAMT
jgi:uncharacterized membrane protein required for colicin V production